jgi:cobalt-zinc-cadmium efflux system protein
MVNGATALLFARGRQGDLNLRAAFQHMAGDAGLSAGVVVAAIVIHLTGWVRLDPTVSLALAAAITWSTWGLLRESIDLAMDAVPEGVSREAVHDYLAGLPGVVEVHDLHIWGLSTTDTALTVHLVCRGDVDPVRLHGLSAELAARFG